MKKILLFTFALFASITMQAQISWSEVFSGFSTDSRGISFIHIGDAQNAWAIAYDGANTSNQIAAITKTSDGGQTWTATDPIALPGTINPGIGMVFSAGGDTAYIAAYKNGNFGSNGVWKTTDGGANWTKITASNIYNSSSSFTNIVYFFDSQNGLTCGDPGANGEYEIFLTNDGGQTWTQVSGDAIPNPQASDEYGYVHSYAAAGNSFWFTTAYGRIFRTTDMGHTWQAFQTPVPDFGGGHINGSFGNITFKDDNEGWITDKDANLYHSTDGGATWTQMSPSGTVYAADIKFVPGTANMLVSVGSASGASGSSYSMDGGATWTAIDNNVQHVSLDMLNDAVGFSGGFSDQASNKGIFVWNNPNASVNESTIEGLKVFPNPATNVVNVSVENANINQITVFDITGKQVINLKGMDTKITTINTSNLENGVYLMKIVDNDNQEQSLKLVIK